MPRFWEHCALSPRPRLWLAILHTRSLVIVHLTTSIEMMNTSGGCTCFKCVSGGYCNLDRCSHLYVGRGLHGHVTRNHSWALVQAPGAAIADASAGHGGVASAMAAQPQVENVAGSESLKRPRSEAPLPGELPQALFQLRVLFCSVLYLEPSVPDQPLPSSYFRARVLRLISTPASPLGSRFCVRCPHFRRF